MIFGLLIVEKGGQFFKVIQTGEIARNIKDLLGEFIPGSGSPGRPDFLAKILMAEFRTGKADNAKIFGQKLSFRQPV